MGDNQGTLIGGALLAGFFLFLAARERLTIYQRILWGPKPTSHSADGLAGGQADGGGPDLDAGKTVGGAVGSVVGGPIGGAIGSIGGDLISDIFD